MRRRKRIPRVLILFYSFSAQTNGLLNKIAEGLRETGVNVVFERLKPLAPLHFPVGSIPRTLKMMFITFFRCRFAIKELSPACKADFDLIILAGPTWSYNPSGPVLSLLDRDGPSLFKGRRVLPLISCRGYWRAHWHGLRKRLFLCGASVPNLIVFTHPNSEPWRTIGVFLKLAGRFPERSAFISRYYRKYGHSKTQLAEAANFGIKIGTALTKQRPLSELNFRTREAMGRGAQIEIGPEVW